MRKASEEFIALQKVNGLYMKMLSQFEDLKMLTMKDVTQDRTSFIDHAEEELIKSMALAFPGLFREYDDKSV